MTGKKKMVMKGRQPELCEMSWMLNFCWDIEDQRPMNNLQTSHYVLKQWSNSILYKQEGAQKKEIWTFDLNNSCPSIQKYSSVVISTS